MKLMECLDQMNGLSWWNEWNVLMKWMKCLDEMNEMSWSNEWSVLMKWMKCLDQLNGMSWSNEWNVLTLNLCIHVEYIYCLCPCKLSLVELGKENSQE